MSSSAVEEPFESVQPLSGNGDESKIHDPLQCFLLIVNEKSPFSFSFHNPSVVMVYQLFVTSQRGRH